jgi:hypothetical protein
MDGSLAGRKSGRIRLRRIHLAGNHPPAAQKNELKPWQHEQWCIPKVSAEFVAAVEEVLDLYEEDTTHAIPRSASTKSWSPPRRTCGLQSQWSQDSLSGLLTSMSCCRTANLFFFVDPFAGWRHVEMTEHHTKIDYAHCIRWLVDQVYPHAEYVRIVQDNLNTRTAAALYEAFPAPEARRILQRVEFHYTSKHGRGREYGRDRDQYLCSWLFVASRGQHDISARYERWCHKVLSRRYSQAPRHGRGCDRFLARQCVELAQARLFRGGPTAIKRRFSARLDCCPMPSTSCSCKKNGFLELLEKRGYRADHAGLSDRT